MHGDKAHPLDGGFKYDLGNDLEIVIKKMPDDPGGLNCSELRTIVAGLWEYIITRKRYRAVTFDILDVQYDAQIGWGHIVKRETDLLSNRIAKRSLQLTSLVLPSSTNSTAGQRNSSLPSPIGAGFNWPIEDSDMTLRFSYVRTVHGGRQSLDRQAVKDLFVAVIEIIQDAIATHGQRGRLRGKTFKYGREVMLEIIDWELVLTWEQVAVAVVGLVDYIVDHDNYYGWYFSIYQDSMGEIGIGQIENGERILGHDNNNNATVARRESEDGEGAG